MKTFVVPLTSDKLLPYLPSVVDGWYILDPGCHCTDFSYPASVDDSSFTGVTVVGSSTALADGNYYYDNNRHFYQASPANGFSITLSGANWSILDPLNTVLYTTPYVDFYSINNTWSPSGMPAPTPTVTLTSFPYTNTAFVCGGYIFPWGYQVVDQTQYITLNSPKGFKGDTTITFVPSTLDISVHDVLKIIYDPGTGDQPLTINRPILATTTQDSFNGFLVNNQFNSPIYKTVSFSYYASSGPITYTPSITALYGDMTRVFFYYNFVVYPNSIYDLDGVHLIGASQAPSVSGGVLSLMSVESRDTIVTNIGIPSK